MFSLLYLHNCFIIIYFPQEKEQSAGRRESHLGVLMRDVLGRWRQAEDAGDAMSVDSFQFEIDTKATRLLRLHPPT